MCVTSDALILCFSYSIGKNNAGVGTLAEASVSVQQLQMLHGRLLLKFHQSFICSNSLMCGWRFTLKAEGGIRNLLVIKPIFDLHA